MTTLKNDNLSDTTKRLLHHDHTQVGPLWVIEKCKTMTEDHQIGLIITNTYSHLSNVTLPNLYKVCRDNNIKLSPGGRIQVNKPTTIKLYNDNIWCEIICRSLDSYEAIAGLQLSWAWSDEVYHPKPEALDLVNERLRDYTNDVSPQLLITT